MLTQHAPTAASSYCSGGLTKTVLLHYCHLLSPVATYNNSVHNSFITTKHEIKHIMNKIKFRIGRYYLAVFCDHFGASAGKEFS